MVVFKIKEWLTIDPKTKFWVYEVSEEYPVWNEQKQDYIFKKAPKRIDSRTAKKIIKENHLQCVYKDEDGRIYE
jgi:hypothetical protein